MVGWYDFLAECVGEPDLIDLMEEAKQSEVIGRGQQLGLTPDQAFCVYAYTMGEPAYGESPFRATNWSLRNPDLSLADRGMEYVRMLQEGLARMPTHQGIVHRRTNLPADVVATAENGYFSDMAFLSTSIRPDLFSGRDYLVVRSETGRAIGTLSRFPDEAEVLFPPRTQFGVTIVSREASGTILIMNEVPNGQP